MLSDEVRSRLALLNRGPLPVDLHSASIPVDAVHIEPAQGDGETTAPKSNMSSPVPAPHFAVCGAFQLPLAARSSTANIEFDAWPRGVEHDSGDGRHLRCRTPLVDLWPGVEQHAAALASKVLPQPKNRSSITAVMPTNALPPIGHPELLAFTKNFPRGTLFLDLETCGFAGSMVFLVGLVWHDDSGLVVDQLFARNYAEERAVLQTLWGIAARCQLLVTFNGKSFDWPMVHDRSTRHHLGRGRSGRTRHAETTVDSGPALFERPLGPKDPRPQLLHCDLLHHARRLWRGRLPNCKLQTLERLICRRERHEDLSGAEVPAAYHRYVREGDVSQVQSILEHNAWDLVTLVQLMMRIGGVVSGE